MAGVGGHRARSISPRHRPQPERAAPVAVHVRHVRGTVLPAADGRPVPRPVRRRSFRTGGPRLRQAGGRGARSGDRGREFRFAVRGRSRALPVAAATRLRQNGDSCVADGPVSVRGVRAGRRLSRGRQTGRRRVRGHRRGRPRWPRPVRRPVLRRSHRHVVRRRF